MKIAKHKCIHRNKHETKITIALKRKAGLKRDLGDQYGVDIQNSFSNLLHP